MMRMDIGFADGKIINYLEVNYPDNIQRSILPGLYEKIYDI